jgi:hypothetical protein
MKSRELGLEANFQKNPFNLCLGGGFLGLAAFSFEKHGENHCKKYLRQDGLHDIASKAQNPSTWINIH